MSKIRNYTIDGDIKTVNVIEPKTKKERFRAKYGVDKGNICRDCIFRRTIDYHNKRYFKCSKLGMTRSTATDIRLSDPACNQFLSKR